MKRLLIIFIISFFIISSTKGFAQDTQNTCFTVLQEIEGYENIEGLETAIALSGNILVVGAPKDIGNGNYTGAAFVYVYNIETQQWSLEKKIFPSSEHSDLNFGSVLDINENGNLIAIGSNNAIWIFENNGSGWTENQTSIVTTASLVPIVDTQPLFYLSAPRDIDISSPLVFSTIADGDDVVGSVIAVSFVGGSNNYKGRVATIVKDSNTWTAGQTMPFTPSDLDDGAAFGSSIKWFGGQILIGTPGDDNGKGAIFIYTYRLESLLAGPLFDLQFDGKMVASNEELSSQLGQYIKVKDDDDFSTLYATNGRYEDTWENSVYVFKRDVPINKWNLTESEIIDTPSPIMDNASCRIVRNGIGFSNNSLIIGNQSARIGGCNQTYRYKNGNGSISNWEFDLELKPDPTFYYGAEFTGEASDDFLIFNNDLSKSVLIINPTGNTLDVSTSEKNALIDFYNSTNGENWVNSTNWNTNLPVSEWHGVETVTYENCVQHVVGINLSSNNLNGSIPDSIKNLTSLEYLSLSNNNLSGKIPDLSLLTSTNDNEGLEGLGIFDNKFKFSDFIDQYDVYSNNIKNFQYSRQKQITENEVFPVIVGSTLILDSTASEDNNEYQWYFNFNPINSATNRTLELVDIKSTDFGDYYCTISNSIIDDLIIKTGTYSIQQDITQHPDYNALVAIYNSTNGDNWLNNTNWLSNEPINTWYGVGTLLGDGNSRVTSLYIGNNNLSGIIPDEIGSLTNLFNLGLSGNNLTGQIPASLTSLNELVGIEIQSNNLSGKIPDFSSNLNLTYFYLWDNNFVFADFEDDFSDYNTQMGTDFIHVPQKPIDENKSFLADLGDTITLTSLDNLGTQLTIDWYKIDALGNYNYIDSGATIDVIINNTNSFGNYIYFVNSDIVTGLSLQSNIISINSNPTNHPDYNALVSFYNALNGQNWINNNNWLDTTKPLSAWYGITETNGRITGINLNNNNLYGTIPESLGELANLEYFSIRQNAVEGSLPQSIQNLTAIQYVDINSNNIVGIIAPWIGIYSNLWYYDIGNNFITGNIPEDITTLNNLQYIYLHNNNLSGSLPSSNIPLNLLVLDASNNNLSGTVPNFGFIPTLTYLNISGNQFEFADLEPNYSDISNSLGANFIYSPQKLVDTPFNDILQLGQTRTLSPNVTGSQNSYTWSRINADGSEGGVITNNQTVDITINTIDDYKWYYFYEATSTLIPGLTLRSNFFKFSESPTTSPDYDALVALYNSTNGDNWTNKTNWLDTSKPISTWYGVVETNGRVTQLGLDNNNLTGTIPPEIGDLSNLEGLYFILNDLTGEIPQEIWSLANLKNLWLGIQESKLLTLNNGISPSISNLQKLEWLNLTYIPTLQPLPNQLFELPNLIRLRMAECGLTGTLPAGLANIDNVIISGNNFEGSIPQEIINSSGNSSLSIENNYFDFAELEPLVTANNYTVLGYSPQRTKDIVQNIELAPGSNITLTIDDPRHNKTDNFKKGTGDEYQWFKDNIAITGATQSTYIINNAQETDNGDYYCEITNSLVQGLIINRANITLNINPTLSVDDLEIASLSIYPNPTSNIINIKLNNLQAERAILYNINGKEVLDISLKSKITIADISKLNSGIYILKIKTTRNVFINKIVKK